jgi:hypothetical protein
LLGLLQERGALRDRLQRRQEEGSRWAKEQPARSDRVELRDQILSLKTPNLSLQKELGFLHRRSEHQEQQLKELSASVRQLKQKLAAQERAGAEAGRALRARCEELMRADLAVRKFIDRAEGFGSGDMAHFKVARSRIVDRANCVLKL